MNFVLKWNSAQSTIPYQLMSQKCEFFHAGFQELYLRPIESSTEYLMNSEGIWTFLDSKILSKGIKFATTYILHHDITWIVFVNNPCPISVPPWERRIEPSRYTCINAPPWFICDAVNLISDWKCKKWLNI